LGHTDELGGLKRRSENENSFPYLFAVADGMGGHEGGEVASAIAVETLFQRYYSGPEDVRDALISAFRDANDAVFTAAKERLAQRRPDLAMPADPAY
jgi:protein phosphatase